MKLPTRHPLDLTYCSSIHGSETWTETSDQLKRHLPGLKARFSENAPMAIGLRLSSAASHELLQGATLEDFKRFLDENGFYVAIINGFPYGAFSGARVKDQVFAPDWTDEARLEYTRRLITILAALLPDGMDGGVSTIPLSYRRWNRKRSQLELSQTASEGLARVVHTLVDLQARTGKTIHLDVEPEPDGFLENSDDLVSFWKEILLRHGLQELTRLTGLGADAATDALARHFQVCYDTCHFALAYEGPSDGIKKLEASGLRVGRIQVSSALRVEIPGGHADRRNLHDLLAQFCEPIYLHQVIERLPNGQLRKHGDLDDALASMPTTTAREWRIHYHVPIFAESFGLVTSTQADSRDVLSVAAQRPVTSQLEIETYTWSVLPTSYQLEIGESIAREYQWALAEVTGAL